jgi:addiction module HigA family antidote
MPMFNPPHPGLGIRAYMSDKVTVSELATHLGMTRANLSMILNGRLGISAPMALKLSEAFPNSSAQFWLNLQNNYDLARARRMKRKKIAPVFVMPHIKKPVSLKKAA